jgi:hypothetical protein
MGNALQIYAADQTVQEPESDEMALSKADREWVQQEIKDALNGSKSGPLRRFLKEWGALSALVTVSATLVVMAVTQFSAANAEKAVNAEFRGRTNARLDAIDKQLAAIQTILIAAHPTNPDSATKVKAIFDDAKKQNVNIPEDTIKQAGSRFLAASESAPAWHAALEVVSYRTHLNKNLRSVEAAMRRVTTQVAIEHLAEYEMRPVSGRALPGLSVGGQVPIDQAVIFNRIGDDNKNKDPHGYQLLVAVGGSLVLDGMHLRHVILDSIEISYSGGPILLQDVIFVNCKFNMVRASRSLQLAQTVLDNPTVGFSD